MANFLYVVDNSEFVLLPFDPWKTGAIALALMLIALSINRRWRQ